MTNKKENIVPFNLNKYVNSLLLIVVLSIVAYLIVNLFISDKNTVRSLLKIQPLYVLVAALFALLPWIFHTIEMMVWGKYLKHKVPFSKLFKIAVATDLGAAVTPTVVGGAPIKLAMLRRVGFSSAQSATILAMITIEDILSFITVAIVSLTLFNKWDSGILQNIFQNLIENWQLKLAIFVGAAILLTLFGRWWLRRYERNSDSFGGKLSRISIDFKETFLSVWKSGKGYFFLGFILILLRWMCTYAVLVFLMLGLSVEMNYAALFLLQWMIFMAMTVVPTPGAAGGAELAFYYVFGAIIPQGIIGVVMAAWRFLTYYFVMLVAALIVALMNFKGK